VSTTSAYRNLFRIASTIGSSENSPIVYDRTMESSSGAVNYAAGARVVTSVTHSSSPARTQRPPCNPGSQPKYFRVAILFCPCDHIREQRGRECPRYLKPAHIHKPSSSSSKPPYYYPHPCQPSPPLSHNLPDFVCSPPLGSMTYQLSY
jgi:hypothetical protein